MSDPAPHPSPEQPPQTPGALPLFVGVLAGNALIGALCLIASGLLQLLADTGIYNKNFVLIPSMVLAPFAGGLAIAWFWRPLRLTIGKTILHTLWASFVGVACAAIFLKEGAVCLIVAWPVLFVFMLVGTLVGRIFYRRDPSRLNLVIAPALGLLALAAPNFEEERLLSVVDVIQIAAPPSAVWPHVLAFPEIPEAPDYWIFRAGLPHPVSTTNGGDFVGADRACNFSDGITIRERIAEFVPERRLTFDVVEQPDHPEAYGHLTLVRGQFDLQPSGDGSTTLKGTSWYRLHVSPAAYFDLWMRDMTRQVHLRVMRHIKRLAEEKGVAL